MKEKLLDTWRELTEPGAAVQGDEQRIQARLFLILLLLLTPVATLGIFIPFLVKPENVSSQYPLLLTALTCFVLLTITYLLARLLNYRVSIIMAVVVGLAAVLTVAYISSPPHNQIALYYLIIPILVGSLFFSPRYALLFTAVSFLALLTAPLYISTIDLYDVLVGPFNLVMAAGAANLLTAYYRRQLDQKRQQELVIRLP